MSTQITSADVAEYLAAQIADLRTKAPGFLQVDARVVIGKHDGAQPSVAFTAYSEHSGHCNGDTLEEAIEKVAAKVAGRSELELIRARVAELVKEVEKLEAAENAGKEAACSPS